MKIPKHFDCISKKEYSKLIKFFKIGCIKRAEHREKEKIKISKRIDILS